MIFGIKRRLLDLGIIKGSTITKVLQSPSGDPSAFEIRGILLAIRKEDAELIKVKYWGDFLKTNKDHDYTIAFAGNPNVGKTTLFNTLTGMHQHTGNWPGKTVANATGIYKYKGKKLLLVDLPGTYSLMSNSTEEEIARDYICSKSADIYVVVVDATCLERSLTLALQILNLTNNVVVCVNLLDEAKKKSIDVDLDLLSKLLGVPVIRNYCL